MSDAQELSDMISEIEMSDEEQRARRATPTNKCSRCGQPLTWAAVRVQFGRMIRRGLTAEEAKKYSPRCGKCTTILLAGKLE